VTFAAMRIVYKLGRSCKKFTKCATLFNFFLPAPAGIFFENLT
jgi:hypothetical protein